MICVEAALTAQGRELVVVDPSELDDDLARDMAEIQTSFLMGFCLWIYGNEATCNSTLRVIEIAVAPQGQDDARCSWKCELPPKATKVAELTGGVHPPVSHSLS